MKTNKSLSCCQVGSSRKKCASTLVAAKLFVCVPIVRGFEEEDTIENVHFVWFCLIGKRSVESYFVFLHFIRLKESQQP